METKAESEEIKQVEEINEDPASHTARVAGI